MAVPHCPGAVLCPVPQCPECPVPLVSKETRSHLLQVPGDQEAQELLPLG